MTDYKTCFKCYTPVRETATRCYACGNDFFVDKIIIFSVKAVFHTIKDIALGIILFPVIFFRLVFSKSTYVAIFNFSIKFGKFFIALYIVFGVFWLTNKAFGKLWGVLLAIPLLVFMNKMRNEDFRRRFFEKTNGLIAFAKDKFNRN
jgi:hypothetical protein